MRVVIAPGSFGDGLGAAAAADAIAAGWREAAPGDELVLVPVGEDGPVWPDGRLDGAGLVVTGVACFDWRSLRDTAVTAVARSAADRGVPCVVLAGEVLVGRREAAAVGVDAAYATTDVAGEGVSAAALAALAARVAARWSR